MWRARLGLLFVIAFGVAQAALPPEEEAALREGKGMGFAKPAELNGYPGPRHVIELAKELQLSPEQLEQTEALFERMQRDARILGIALIESERELDELYVSKRATAPAVEAVLTKIETIRARLRAIHLNAHLDQSVLLTPRQRAQYAELRGYSHALHPEH